MKIEIKTAKIMHQYMIIPTCREDFYSGKFFVETNSKKE